MTFNSKLALAILAAGLTLPATGALSEAKVSKLIENAEETADAKATTDEVRAEAKTDTNAQVEAKAKTEDAKAETGETGETDETVEPTRAQAEPMDLERTRSVLGAEPTGMFFAEDERRVTVADMMHRTVVSTEGEALGDITRVVENGGKSYFVVEHGGFLGIGDEEIAIPVERTALMGEAVVVSGMTEEELDALPEYDADAEITLTIKHSLDIQQVRQ